MEYKFAQEKLKEKEIGFIKQNINIKYVKRNLRRLIS